MSNSTIYIDGQANGNRTNATAKDSTMNFKMKVEEIHDKNIDKINIEISKTLKKELDNMARYIPLDESTRAHLAPITIDYLRGKVKRQIENRLVIENLYPENMKEEAFNRLPVYIRELRR